MKSSLAVALVAAALCGLAAAEFNLDRAIKGVYLSKVAYCNAPQIASWTCDACPKFPGMQNVSAYTDPGYDSSGWVGYDSQANEIYYAFRGTVDLTGWIEDADFFQTAYEPENSNCTGCLVHEGLYWGYKKIAKVLQPHLQELVYAHPTADILVAGHSMGAAQAGFAFPDVVRLIKGSRGIKRLYNYGCPRLGNPAFVAWLENVIEPQQEHYRCTNYGDPIPHLAPIVFDKLGLGNWLHEPREVFFPNAFGNPKDHKICAGTVTREDPTCADSSPWYTMLSFRNHTTYLDIGMGCFLGPPNNKN